MEEQIYSGKELHIKRKHAMKLARRRANRHNRNAAIHAKHKQIGKLVMVKTMTALVPQNSRGRTDYLLPADATYLAEKVLSGYKLYIGWRSCKTYEDLENLPSSKKYIARNKEVKTLNIPCPIQKSK